MSLANIKSEAHRFAAENQKKAVASKLIKADGLCERSKFMIGADAIGTAIFESSDFTNNSVPFIAIADGGADPLAIVSVETDGKTARLRFEDERAMELSGGILDEHLASMLFTLADGSRFERFNINIFRDKSAAELPITDEIEPHFPRRFAIEMGLPWFTLMDDCPDPGGPRPEWPPCECFTLGMCNTEQTEKAFCNSIKSKCHGRCE